jgi:hypothetical protein
MPRLFRGHGRVNVHRQINASNLNALDAVTIRFIGYDIVETFDVREEGRSTTTLL